MAGSQGKQQGAALVVVLSLLSMTLMLGITGMSSSLVDERLAGNYRASVMAYNEAEAGLFAFNDELREAVFASNPTGFIDELRDAAREARDADTPQKAQDALEAALPELWSTEGSLAAGGRYSWRLVPMLPEDSDVLAGQVGVRIESKGFFGEAENVVIGLVALPEAPPSGSRGLMSCEGVAVKGSGKIDSYDSRDGSYGGSNANRSNVVVGSQTEGAEIRVTGSSPIYGDVAASGTFVVTGSGAVHGNVKANDTVTISGGGANIYGNVTGLGNVAITSSGTVHGDVLAAGTLSLGNWNSRIKGNATVGAVTSVRTPSDQVDGELDADSGGPQNLSEVYWVATPGECDVPPQTARYQHYLNRIEDSSGALNLQGGPRNIILDGSGINDPNNSNLEVTMEDYEDQSGNVVPGKHLVRFDSFRLAGSANFRIGSVGNPVDMVMVVTGDIDIGGGGSFSIAEGSSLTIVTQGEFKLASGIVVGDGKPARVDANGKVRPILSLISVHDDSSHNRSGVFIGGNSDFYGQITAPYSHVEITGSGNFYGEVFGQTVEVKGNGGFHYDEAFGETEGGVGGGGSPGLPRLRGIWPVVSG